MPNYSYQARDDAGKLVKGIMAAEDEQDLSRRLKNMGYFLTQLKLSSSAKRTQTAAKLGHLSQVEVLHFTTQVAISLDAGVPLLTILKDLGVSSPQKKI